MPGALTEKDATRLAQFCGMLGSDHDGERANAVAFATRTLKAAGWTWEDLVRLAVRGAAVPAAPRPPRERGLAPRAQIHLLLQHSEWLSAWESSFVSSLSRQTRPLSDKQRGKLSEVFGRVLARLGDEWV